MRMHSRWAQVLATLPFLASIVAAACGGKDNDGTGGSGTGATGGTNGGAANGGAVNGGAVNGGAVNGGATTDAGSAGAAGGEAYSGSAVVIPAMIEAEAFVSANELNRSYDESAEECLNSANPDVDVNAFPDGGCFIGYASGGEWLEYDIYAASAGAFDFTFMAGSGETGMRLSVSIDDEPRGSVVVPSVDWDTYGPITLTAVNIAPGEHRLRITFDTGAVNLDWIEISAAGPCVSDCGGEIACGTDQCGESCGTCAADETCTAARQCLDAEACAATCGERLCGLDDCGGSCGECPSGTVCTPVGGCFDPSTPPVARFGQLAVQGGKVVGEDGAPAQLKGVSTQWLNWEKTYSTSQPALEWMRDNWGLSVLRIANGVENNGGYLARPEEQLALVKQIIENAIATDVYAIVDWHTHEIEHVEEAKAFFAEIAATYGDTPNVIYEVFNEPVRHDWATEVQPYHEAVIAEIRQHDPDNLILLGTPNWDQRLDQAAADPVAGDNLAYSLHFYSCTHTGGVRANGQAALDAGLAVFVSEWGATHSDGGTASNPGVCEAAAREWHAWMEANDIGWAAWKLSSDPDDSAFLAPNAPVTGGWTDEQIKGHGYLIREFMTDER